MKNQIKRKLGYVLVITMLIVMIYPGEMGTAAEASNGFYLEDGTLVQYVGAENAVKIPEEVTKIGESAFLNTTITSVEIPEGVTSIGENAFSGCQYLTDVTIPASVVSVGENVFYGCTSLESVVWKSTAGIPVGAFKDCVGLTDLEISTGLPSIDSEAFKNCESLVSFAVPAATKEIATDAFDGCINMEAINVEQGNTYYTANDNVLYSVSGATLYRCPQGSKSITVHDGTKMIATGSFYGCSLGTVTMPQSVETISEGAFEGSEIQKLILGSAVREFGAQDTSFKIHSIEVASNAPVAEQLVEEYGEIVVTTAAVVDDTETPGDSEDPGNTETPGSTEDPGNTENPGNSEMPSVPENPDSTEKLGEAQSSGERTQPETVKPNNAKKPKSTENSGNGNSGNSGNGSTAGSGTGTNTGTGTSSGNNNSNKSDKSNNSNNNSSNNTANNSDSNNIVVTDADNSKLSDVAGNETTESTQAQDTTEETAYAEQGTAYIADHSEQQGWDMIYEWMQTADDGSTIFITMNGTTLVPQRILELAYNKSLTLALDMGNDISWTIKGKDIIVDNLGDIDFGVTMGTGNVPQDLQKDVADDSWSTQLHLAYEGVFGLTGLLTVNVGTEHAGQNATLFYYNEEAGKLEYIDMAFVGENGSVIFSFAHASDYVIVLDGYVGTASGISVVDTTLLDAEVKSENTASESDAASESDGESEDNGTTESDTASADDGVTDSSSATDGSSTLEKDNTPTTGQTLNAKYILCLGVMLMGIYMILTSKKEEDQITA